MTKLSAREIALRVLTEYPGRAKPDDLLEELLGRFDPDRRERALATQIVSGTIKWRGRLDHIVKQFSRKSRVVSPVVLNVLRLSLYQLLFLDRVPDYGATNEGVKLVKQYGDEHQASYVNAILRRFLREKDKIEYPSLKTDPVKHIAARYSHPAWLVSRWLKRWSVDEVISLAEANNRVPSIGLRVNTMRTTLKDLEAALTAEGIEIVSSGFAGTDHVYVRGASPVDRLRVHREGLVQVQDASSTLVGRVLSPEAGSATVDLCSAPGGKATHLYEIMGGKGTLIASDVSLDRLPDVKRNALRLGHEGMLYAVSDARTPAFKDADFVLVDAPCTGLGVLARRWDLRWTKRESDIVRMASYQRKILNGAIEIVKRGGVVVYSTCSLEPEENEKIVETVVAKRSDVRLADISRFVPETVVYKEGMMQTLPHRDNVDGIFAARLEKV
ncbi:MAG: 16S rRNA (cytosine(967)-C(5))-methyltransferase RsmB [Candidatus Eisenbacteria bacterium]